jgi:penicillin amidase
VNVVVVVSLSLIGMTVNAGCGGRGTLSGAAHREAAEVPQISGTLAVSGVSAPVRVIRDRWGVAHVKAENPDDLFFAQGFVQAQDRLFQMDLWRRAAQGRLSEVLGPNFIERDAMTRRMRYRGDLESEWASYGPDTKAIAIAFARGINARIRLIGQRLPEEFVLAGWAPEAWRPEDVLNRTDAFVASGDAQDEVFRAELTAALGAARANALLAERAPLVVPPGVDVSTVSSVVGDNLRRAGTPPFFTAFAVPFSTVRVGSNAWAVARGDKGAPLVAADPHVRLETPSRRYLIHLEAPGWNVIGATSPWLPGVAIGHNDHVAWGMTAFAADTQDLYIERVNPSNSHQVADRGRFVDMTVEKEAIGAKGREPYIYDRLYTPHGVVVALDPEKHLAFTLQWTGFQPGTASEIAALALDRAESMPEFRAALTRWKMPPAEFVFAATDGHVSRQVAALVPMRIGWSGALPVAGGSQDSEWRAWTPLDRLPHQSDLTTGYVASANDSRPRLARIRETLDTEDARSVEGFKRLQQDVLAWNARQLVPLLSRVRADRPEVEESRGRLLGWDKALTATSQDAALYVAWERLLMRRLAAFRVPQVLVERFVARAGDVLVAAIVKPSAVWFDGNVARARDALLLSSLAAAVDELPAGRLDWGSRHAVVFAHPLGITPLARERFSIGPIPAPGYADTVLSISVESSDRSVGPSFRVIMDAGNWDRSVATNAPGQAGYAGSPHYSDLMKTWPAGDYFPLPFTAEAVQRSAVDTLMLIPLTTAK